LLIDLMILKKDEPRVEKFVLNGRIELAFYVHTGSNLTTFGRLKYPLAHQLSIIHRLPANYRTLTKVTHITRPIIDNS
jgi:hypothetical protein